MVHALRLGTVPVACVVVCTAAERKRRVRGVSRGTTGGASHVRRYTGIVSPPVAALPPNGGRFEDVLPRRTGGKVHGALDGHGGWPAEHLPVGGG